MMRFIDTQEGDGFLLSAWDSPNVSEKLALICEALELAESTGDTRGQLESLWQLGWLDQTNRFYYWEKALALTRVSGDAYELASGLSTAGLFLALNGDLNAAQKYLAESNALYEQLHMKPVVSHLLSAYGQISLIRGDFKKARAYLQEHARASLELGSRQDYLWSRVRLGYVALREGNVDEASHTFGECTQEFRKDRNIIGVVFAVEGLAGLFSETDNFVRAARLIGWADSTREKISDRRPLLEQADIDKIIALCTKRMGRAQFSEACNEGRKMSLEEAITFALGENY
jgi:tetratricopeptide (TPR) repeat protein